jgi:hypothetical protein
MLMTDSVILTTAHHRRCRCHSTQWRCVAMGVVQRCPQGAMCTPANLSKVSSG